MDAFTRTISGRRAGMRFGEAYKILENIDSERYTAEEKGTAIRIILDMATHNGITKTLLLRALNWLWNEHFEIIQTGEQK